MSQFTLLFKCPEHAHKTTNTFPDICFLEQTPDHMIYLWPLAYTFHYAVILNPHDPADRKRLLMGEYIACGGRHHSISLFLARNGLLEEHFYQIPFGMRRDITEARDILQVLEQYLQSYQMEHS